MKSEWLPHTILRAASLLAPGDERAEWLEGWRSELWYVPRRGATRFCLGAFRDAFWLRRNNPSPVNGSLIRPESPLSCLAFLAALAAVSLAIAVFLPGPKRGPVPSHQSVRSLADGCMGMLFLSCVILTTTRLAMGGARANRLPNPWPGRLRRGIFLALKVALLQPIMFCGFVVLISIGLVFPVAPPLGAGALWILALRWVITDQRGRCPVCLRLLTSPVRIGTVSQTFLAWHGAESICSRGHGLLQVSETPGTSGNSEWLSLDASWNRFLSEAAGVRQR